MLKYFVFHQLFRTKMEKAYLASPNTQGTDKNPILPPLFQRVEVYCIFMWQFFWILKVSIPLPPVSNQKPFQSHTHSHIAIFNLKWHTYWMYICTYYITLRCLEKLIDSRNMYGLKNTRSSENVKSWCEIWYVYQIVGGVERRFRYRLAKCQNRQWWKHVSRKKMW